MFCKNWPRWNNIPQKQFAPINHPIKSAPNLIRGTQFNLLPSTTQEKTPSPEQKSPLYICIYISAYYSFFVSQHLRALKFSSHSGNHSKLVQPLLNTVSQICLQPPMGKLLGNSFGLSGASTGTAIPTSLQKFCKTSSLSAINRSVPMSVQMLLTLSQNSWSLWKHGPTTKNICHNKPNSLPLRSCPMLAVMKGNLRSWAMPKPTISKELASSSRPFLCGLESVKR